MASINEVDVRIPEEGDTVEVWDQEEKYLEKQLIKLYCKHNIPWYVRATLFLEEGVSTRKHLGVCFENKMESSTIISKCMIQNWVSHDKKRLEENRLWLVAAECKEFWPKWYRHEANVSSSEDEEDNKPSKKSKKEKKPYFDSSEEEESEDETSMKVPKKDFSQGEVKHWLKVNNSLKF